MAVVFGFVGLLINPFLLIIAVFVWVGATAEAGAVQFRVGLAGVPVGRAMIREFTALAPDSSLGDAARRVIDGFQQDFPVTDSGNVVGILPQDALLRGLAEAGLEGRVGEFMRTDFEVADPRDMVEPAFQKLRTGSCTVLPVLRDGQLVGLLTPDNVVELVMIREAVRGRNASDVAAT
jgi:predicted transcriptional regulator